MKIIIQISLLTILLSGCVSVRNIDEAKLMPESVAKTILAKYSSNSWVNNPVGKENDHCSSGPFKPFPFTSIARVMLPGRIDGIKNNEIVLADDSWICPIMIKLRSPTPFTEDELNDVLDALVSLGAKLSEETLLSKASRKIDFLHSM